MKSKQPDRLAGNHEDDINLIAIGVSRFPIRRPFISDLRLIYPDVPMLILRREVNERGEGQEVIRGEFILSDVSEGNDLEIVSALRAVFPLAPCRHTVRDDNYDTVREVVRFVAENYADPELDLNVVASRLPISPARLSRILNRHVGVSFRQLLRQTRIEEAKRLLASCRYSIKEVAARVGFSDNHYFSRSFKEITGHNASDYKVQNRLFN
ncbi:MAG: helix-turn-helix transcriptional regulator [Pyrinomonadaceae bacterium]